MGRFNRESFIIQDKDVLRDDYQPETLEERDEELDEYAAAPSSHSGLATE